MWILLALASAFFAGITAVLAKVGIRKTDSHLATALRTLVVLVFAWGLVLSIGSHRTLPAISPKTYLFLFCQALPPGPPGSATSGRCKPAT